ncbi:MAG TPA: hypothetical protein VKB78_11120, partial [Pirellulales bacterium]|nr:hypothetical protein [Pirellulales bacterium]
MLTLHKVSPGEPITADWANALVDAVLALGRIAGVAPVQVQTSEAGTLISVPGLPRLDLVELNDTLESRDTDKQVKRFAFDPAESDPWIDSGQTLEHTAEPQQGLYLAGERHLAFFHPAAGQRIPIPGVQFHFGKLSADLAAGGSATCEIWMISSGSPADSTFSVTAYDWLLPPGGKLESGSPVLLLFHQQSKRFYVTGTNAGFGAVIGKTSGAIAKGSSGTVKVYNGTAGSESDSGSTITAYNPF